MLEEKGIVTHADAAIPLVIRFSIPEMMVGSTALKAIRLD
jgi:hypothetical protein